MSDDLLTLTRAPDPLAPTIFHEEWWLDLASRGRFGVSEVRENGHVIARLPYATAGVCALDRRIVMPMLTHFLGPAVCEGEGSASARLARRIELTRELIGQLPSALSVTMKCHAGVTDTIPFQMERFLTHVQYTYEIAPQNPDEVWMAMRSQRRTIIRGAQKRCEVITLDDPGVFMRFYDDNLKLNGLSSIYDDKICETLIDASLRRGRGQIWAATSEGRLQAAVFCVRDAQASYYLMTTRHPHSHSGAVSLLAFEAIKDAMARGLTFDLDGLSDAGGVAFFTGFCGRVSPRYIVVRETRMMRLYRALCAATIGGESTYA